MVRWNENHFSAAFNLLKFHQFGGTGLPETLLENVWYAGREVWKGTLLVADFEQVDKKDASEFHNMKLNPKEVVSLELLTIPKTADGQFKIYWRRSGSQNSNFDKVPSKFEEKFKKTFLENQKGFHHRPKQEVIAHQHSLYRDQRYPHQNCFEKICGKTCHELLQQADLRRLSQVKQVAIMVLGLSTMSSLSSLSTPTFPTSSTLDVKGSIPDPASIECESEDREVWRDPYCTPTIQEMST